MPLPLRSLQCWMRTTMIDAEFFAKVETLRKNMLLTTEQMCKLIDTSRMSYYGWVKGKPLRKSSEEKVKTTVKKLLRVMKDHDWPTSEEIVMPSDMRFERLKTLLADY